MLAVDIGLNFAGSAPGVDSNSFAPNTMGAVGPEHIVELINERYTVYDKTGNPLESSNLNDFWTLTAGATISGNSIQPSRCIRSDCRTVFCHVDRRRSQQSGLYCDYDVR